jgi:hypothetical protein
MVATEVCELVTDTLVFNGEAKIDGYALADAAMVRLK